MAPGWGSRSQEGGGKRIEKIQLVSTFSLPFLSSVSKWDVVAMTRELLWYCGVGNWVIELLRDWAIG